MEIGRGRSAPAILATLMCIGAFEQIAQVLLIREFFVVFKGNEVSFGVVFAFWMFWTAMGSCVMGLFSGKIQKPVAWLCFLNIILCIFLVVEIYLTRISRGFFSVPSGAYLSIFSMGFFTFVLLSGVCFIGGTLFVVGAKLYTAIVSGEGGNAPLKTYIADSLGCLAGGLAVTFIFVVFFDAFTSGFIAAFVLLCASSWLAFREGLKKTSMITVMAAGIFGILCFVGPSLEAAAYKRQWNVFNEKYELAEVRNSKYQNIAILEYKGQHSLFGNGGLYFSMPDETVPREAAGLYMLQNEQPRNILVIGGGISGLLRWLLEFKAEKIDYVELDPVVIETSRKYLVEENERAIQCPEVILHYMDGRFFVKRTKETYDLVICNLPDPSTASLNRFYTLEFFRDVKEILDEKGVFVTGVCASGFWAEEMLNRNASIYATLMEVFPQVIASPSGEFYSGFEDSSISLKPDRLVERYKSRNLNVEDFVPEIFHVLLEPDSVRAANEKLEEKRGTGPVLNRDSYPISYHYNLVIWNRQSETEWTEAFDWMIKVRLWWVLPVIGLMLLPVFILSVPSSLREKKIPSCCSVVILMGASGLFGMIVEIMLLYWFQNAYGYVYSMIGLLTAMFMSGLAAGAILSSRAVRRFKIYFSTVLAGIASLVFCSIVAGLTLSGIYVAPAFAVWLFLLLNLVGGCLVGLMFGLMTGAAAKLKWRPEKSAGFLYGADLAGACFGSLTAGSLLIPVLGMQSTCLAAGLVLAAALAAFMFSFRKM